MTVFKKDKDRRPGTPGSEEPLLVASGTQDLLAKKMSSSILFDV
jgi:hypothetical protein